MNQDVWTAHFNKTVLTKKKEKNIKAFLRPKLNFISYI